MVICPHPKSHPTTKRTHIPVPSVRSPCHNPRSSPSRSPSPLPSQSPATTGSTPSPSASPSARRQRTSPSVACLSAGLPPRRHPRCLGVDNPTQRTSPHFTVGSLSAGLPQSAQPCSAATASVLFCSCFPQGSQYDLVDPLLPPTPD